MTKVDVSSPATPHVDEASVSLLFPRMPDGRDVGVPACFADLNLDRVEDWLAGTRSREAPRYRDMVRQTFRTLVTDPEVISYRLAVFGDLSDPGLRQVMTEFNEAMKSVRRLTTGAKKSGDQHVGEGLRMRAISSYVDAVEACADALDQHRPESDGLRRVQDFLSSLRRSEGFERLAADNRSLNDRLQQVHYALRIRGGRVTVTPERYEGDYSAEVLATFERFRQVDAEDHLVRTGAGGMGYIEAVILGFVARENRELFAEVNAHVRRQERFLHPVVDRLDSELEFLLAYCQLIDQLTAAGRTFVRPELIAHDDRTQPSVTIEGGVDLALALKTNHVIPNSVGPAADDLFVVVSGPNQGGKTTFVRMIGQICYLAGLGCPVPARLARIRPIDQIYTHFERQEDRERETPGGKLEDDLVRIREILDHATDRSLILINEMFASTTLADAAYLGDKILDQLERIGAFTVWVTFVEDLARRSGRTVSMVSQTRKDDPTVRTFEVLPQAPAGRIYAEAIAALHGLRGEDILQRIAEVPDETPVSPKKSEPGANNGGGE